MRVHPTSGASRCFEVGTELSPWNTVCNAAATRSLVTTRQVSPVVIKIPQGNSNDEIASNKSTVMQSFCHADLGNARATGGDDDAVASRSYEGRVRRAPFETHHEFKE